jgi:hypothetical protein
MAKKKPEWLQENVAAITKYCDDNGFVYEKLSPYQYRVYGAVSIVDIYPSRMVYRVWSIDGVEQPVIYHTNMKQQIDLTELKSLLEKGWVR